MKKTQANFRLAEQTISELDKLAAQMRVSRTAIIELAIANYLKQSHTTTEEKAVYRTTPRETGGEAEPREG